MFLLVDLVGTYKMSPDLKKRATDLRTKLEQEAAKKVGVCFGGGGGASYNQVALSLHSVEPVESYQSVSHCVASCWLFCVREEGRGMCTCEHSTAQHGMAWHGMVWYGMWETQPPIPCLSHLPGPPFPVAPCRSVRTVRATLLRRGQSDWKQTG